jgi:hypothetical protein
VGGWPRGGRAESVDHVLRRADLGIAAAQVDERLAWKAGGGLGQPPQRHEVLLGQTRETVGRTPHVVLLLHCRLRNRNGHPTVENNLYAPIRH